MNPPAEHPKWLKRIPNQLTLLRIICIPFVVFFMIQANILQYGEETTPQTSDLIAAALFLLAAFTDFLDGWIARRFNVETVLGKLLDPLADKLLHVSALIILVEKQRLMGWVAVLLIVRDLAINAIRVSAMEENIIITSSFIAKTKSFFLDITIIGLIIHGTLFGWFPALTIGKIAMWLALITSWVSGLAYLLDYFRKLKLTP